jgi:hypothetical protein
LAAVAQVEALVVVHLVELTERARQIFQAVEAVTLDQDHTQVEVVEVAVPRQYL